MDWIPVLTWDIPTAVFAVFLLVWCVQLFYYLRYFRRLAFYRPINKKGYPGPVSVVICARNEYHNLVRNLPLILKQDYHDFEVVVVDDASDDDTAQLLQQLQNQHAHLKVISLKESVNFFKGKKLPLSVGIKSARHDVVLLTDADCIPAGPHWITRMVDNYEGDKQIVLGYGGYEPRPGLLNKLIRFDTLFIAMQYFGMALSGKPYMGVGRNLSYKKDLFFKVKGFTSHYKIMAGDDDLFINQVATPTNVAVEISPHSHTFSLSKNTFRAWLQQKRRHMATGKYYQKKHKRLLGLFSFISVIFYPLLIMAILLNGIHVYSLAAVGLFVIKGITFLIIFSRISNKFNERRIIPFSLFFEVLYPFINLIFVLASLFYTKQIWK